MNIRLDCIVIDVPDLALASRFYQTLLGFTETYADEVWVSLSRADLPVRLGLQYEPDYKAPDWPSGDHGQMLHLDFTVDDVPAAVAFAESLGATKAAEQFMQTGVTMLDPFGHPFCLLPDESGD